MWPFRRRGKSEASGKGRLMQRRADRRRCANSNSNSSSISKSLGGRGETLALRMLKRRGLKVLARNYRCPAGEADLIVLDKATRGDSGAETIVFVEVKTRSSDRYTDPQYAVNADKQRRMRKIADYFLTTRPADGYNVRFDVVAICLRDGNKPEITYIQDAF
jgi:putative endonuclease